MEATRFLTGIIEEQIILANLSMELHFEYKNLMVEEHNGIIKEDLSSFNNSFSNAITALLQKIEKIIIAIKSWMVNTFKRFVKFMQSLIHNLKARLLGRRFSTLATTESEIDFEVLANFNITQYPSFRKITQDYVCLSRVTRKEEYDTIKNEIDTGLLQLKQFYNDSIESSKAKKVYNGGDVEKLLSFMTLLERNTDDIGNSIKDMNKDLGIMKKFVEEKKETDFCYFVGTYAVFVHNELYNLLGNVLSQITLATQGIDSVIHKLAG